MKNAAAKVTTDLKTSNELVVLHESLVKRIAYHLMSRLPASVQADDLIQAGMIGLIEASRKFDPEQGASFETYAGIRIRGSMLHEPSCVRNEASSPYDESRQAWNHEYGCPHRFRSLRPVPDQTFLMLL